MAQQEKNQRYSNSSSGGCTGGVVARSSKKLKQKKAPQRGLGVAQLEKIRLEEQQKRDVIFPIISPSNSSSCLASQSANFRPDVSSSLPSITPTDHHSPNRVIRQQPMIPNSNDVIRTNATSKSVSNNGGECEMGWQGIARGAWPKLYNDEYNFEGDVNYKLDHQGSNALRSCVNVPCETKNPLWPLPGVMPLSQPFQEAYPSSMVNVSLGTSSSCVMNFEIEPPSNQRYRSNNSTTFWPEEEKMIALKRSCPFSIDDAPVPSFNCRFPPSYVSHIPITDEPAAFSNDGTLAFGQANPVLIGPSSSSVMSEYNKRNITKANGGLNGHFLTLAPPEPKDPPSFLSPYIRELPDFDALPYQAAPDVPVHWPLSRSVEQPFFSFFPSAQNGQSTVTVSNNNDGIVEHIDLNLKL